MKSIFTSPHFPDEDQTRAARILWTVLIAFMAISGAMGISALFTHDTPIPLVLSGVVMVSICVGGLFLVHRGFVTAVSVVLCVILWLFFSMILVLNGGSIHPTLVNFITLIVIAGLTLGRWAGIVSAIAAISTSITVNFMTLSGVINQQVLPSTPSSIFVAYGGNFLLAAVLLGVSTTDAQRAIERARNSEQRLRLAQDKLIEAEKLRAAGELAAGVAHDFGNLLTAVNGHAAMIESDTTENSSLAKETKGIRDVTKKAKTLVDQLLIFGRRQVLKPQSFYVNELIENMEILIERSLGSSVSLSLNLCESNPRIYADSSQFEQVIVNLVMNAKDAMPNGGVFSVTSSCCVVSMNDSATPAEDQEYVKIEISDTGFGMDDLTKQRVFEPFYTTKDIGRGTGLGLSTAHSIVTQSSGHIAIDSAVGVGTTVEILLPLSSKTL